MTNLAEDSRTTTAPTPRPVTAGELKSYFRDETAREALLFPEMHTELTQGRTAVTGAQLYDRQQQALHVALTTAIADVPAYQELAPVDADDPMGALASWPTLEKAILRDDLARYTSRRTNRENARMTSTSGTSGIPVKLVIDRTHQIQNYVSGLDRARRRGDSPYNRKILMISQFWAGDWSEYVAPSSGFAIVGNFDKQTMRTAPEVLRQRLNFFDADLVFGEPPDLLEFAEFVAAGGADVTWRPRRISSQASHLSPSLRHRVTEVLGVPIHDHYGMREAGTIATQCDAGSYHIDCDRLWVEVLDDDGHVVAEGERGEITVSNFFNFAMPVLRFRTGDYGRLLTGGCPCGDPRKLMRLDGGRRWHLMEMSNGEVLEPNSFTRLFNQYPILQFQVVRRSRDAVTVQLQCTSAAEFDRIRPELETRLRALASVLEVNLVAATPADFLSTRSRKHSDFVDVTVTD